MVATFACSWTALMTRVPKLDICLPIREGWSAPSSVPCLCAAECAKNHRREHPCQQFQGPRGPDLHHKCPESLFSVCLGPSLLIWRTVIECPSILVTSRTMCGEAEAIGNSRVCRPHPADAGDWITKGVMTPEKNLRQCGSYWAFSITDSLDDACCL